MKNLNKLILALSFGAIATFTSAQQIANLEGINYQAVAIDTDGQEIVGKDVVGKPLYTKDIGVRFTITAGPNGSVYYQETHSTTTDENGLFSLNIGLGTLTPETDYSDLLSMPWINGDQWLVVEVAIGDDGNFEEVSNQKFMAVPYAFYTDDIADDAITTEKILDSTILNQDFSTGSVDTRVIEDSTILNEDMATASVDTRVIEDSTILNQDMATGSVDTRVIEDSTILNEDIATGSVDTRVILDSTIINEDMSTGSVDSRVILDSTLLNEDMATASVDTRVIEDSTILNEDMSTGSVDTRVIEDLTILNEDMSTGSVDTRVIENGTILNEDIEDGTIDLTTKVTNVLPVPNGGTGLNTITPEGILVGNGTGDLKVFPPLDSGQIITHIDNDTEIYKLEAGDRMDIVYDKVNKTVTFNAAQQGSAGLITLDTTQTVTVPSGVGNQVKLVYTVDVNNDPIPGALGDIIAPAVSETLDGITLTGYVSAPGEITLVFFNGTTTDPITLTDIDIRIFNLGQ